MADIEQWQQEIGEWADRTFPTHRRPDGRGNLSGPVWHLADPVKGEVHELLAAFQAGRPLSEEVADIVILCLTIAHLAEFSLEEAIKAKMARNQRRHWGVPDEHGVYVHIDESTQEVG